VRRTAFAPLAGAATLVALAILAAPAMAAPTVIAGGMFDPRGIAAGPGEKLLVAQSGSGEITQIRDADDDEPAISTFATLPLDPELGGPVDVAVSHSRRAYVLSGGDLLRVRRGGETSLIADIAAYQQGDPDLDDLEEAPTESNPNGLALLKDRRVLVADAAGNDLLLVDHDGEITTVARFKPEEVPWPSGVPDGPPPGTPVPAEAVPTSVAVGPDGAWYVSELKGFPFHPGSSRIWRIEPGATDAVCDPAQPDSGECRTVETGFTSVIDIAFGDDGELYVLEIAKAGLLTVEVFGADPIGALWRVEDGSKTELEAGSLLAPGGVAVGEDEELYVTTATFLGPDAGEVVRIDPQEEEDD
jgi:hypothetical protein